ncbi:uncharacterized protein C16orf86 isoform X2 [Rhinatrema bivittatum]|uniref:uncharacterized protein C16orf86 isoform X2 n=1 Tax=Rhinatrema bivittatum TaxID=194408 RepID=UPI00112CFB0A|nr:uncharacterized protein C16orf86 isoform X2 [Rhinatrema bivittatum]
MVSSYGHWSPPSPSMSLQDFWHFSHSGIINMQKISRMTEEKKSAKSSRKVSASRFLNKLAGILDNPKLKSFEWDEEGRAVVVNARLYEEEIAEHADLLLEFQNFRTISMLHGLLCTYGFKKKTAKVHAEVHVFQHSDFKRKCVTRKQESESSKADSSLNIKQSKKAKKRKRDSAAHLLVPATAGSSALTPESLHLERKLQRVRPLYQYINYDNPEMNTLSEGETDTEGTTDQDVAAGEQEISYTGRLNIFQQAAHLSVRGMEPGNQSHEKEESLNTMKSLSGNQVKSELDKSTQADIDKMLSVCAAHLVPPLSPQYK